MIFEKQIAKIYKSQLFCRFDDNGYLKYFTHEDFIGLRAEGYSFKNKSGDTLHGNFYRYENPNDAVLVIFEHGLGGGHLSYMREIEILCSAGFTVFAYDHTGCMSSEGKSAGGFSQSLSDLDDCINSLKSDGLVGGREIYTVGHSRGGLSALNAPAIHKEVKKAVGLSAPISAKRMIEQNFIGPLALYRKGIMEIERKNAPEYVDYEVQGSLLKSGVKALLIYSDDDRLVSKKYHYDVLYREFSGNKNIKLVLEHGKGHNPNYTVSAAKTLSQMFSSLKKAAPVTDKEKDDFKNSQNWEKLTEQDMLVWQRITEFLNEHAE